MTIDEFEPQAWVRCRGVLDEWLSRMQVRDPARLYLTTPFDDFWYLGERLAFQTRGRHMVPFDPPSCLFIQTRDPVVRHEQFREGESATLLLSGEDYMTFTWSRLACGPLEEIDEDMEH